MRQAVVALIIKNSFVLSISRRYDLTKFGLVGGKVDHDESLEQALCREVQEECGLFVKKCVHIFTRVEPKKSSDGEDFECHCFYIPQWEGSPSSKREGEVKWILVSQLLDPKIGVFVDYNKLTFEAFRIKYPKNQLLT